MYFLLDRLRKSKELESKMAQEAQIERDKVKLLLLGAGESGILNKTFNIFKTLITVII